MPLIRFARRLMLVVAADALVLETMANPVGNTTLPVYSGAVLPASVSSITSSDNVMNVVQAGNRAVINWESFSIGAAARLVINQPKGSVLINVAGGGASQINGAISGGLVGSTYGATNGAVWIINPSGLIFGTGSTVNVNSLLVSTLAPDLSDPSTTRFRADPGSGSSSIALNGQVTAGSIIAASPNITQGLISVLNAKTDVRLIASDNLQLSLDSGGLIATKLQPSTAATLLNTQGTIRVGEGAIELTASGQRIAGMALVNIGGDVQATGANSNIYLNAP
ncbi:MAG: filamentous hemagglutinin N-terminal domain-containing protein [Betaproteobacteria bacterium]